jgi:hypothetical protein
VGVIQVLGLGTDGPFFVVGFCEKEGPRRYRWILLEHSHAHCIRVLGQSRDGAEGWIYGNAPLLQKQRRVERLPSGYSIREFYNHPQGRYWYVVTALEVKPTNKCPR